MKRIYNTAHGIFEVVKTNEVISILRHDFDNGYVSIKINSDNSKIEFAIISNCVTDSYASIVTHDLCQEVEDIECHKALVCPTTSLYRKYKHPLSEEYYENFVDTDYYCNNRIIKFILNLIRFTCYNDMSLFISGYDKYPEIEEFLIEPIGEISCSQLEKIREFIPYHLLNKWYTFSDGSVEEAYANRPHYCRDGLYLPVSVIKNIRKIAGDFGYTEFSHSGACVNWSKHYPLDREFTVDAVYSLNKYLDEMLEEYVSESMDIINLYLDEYQNSCNYISDWSVSQCEDWLSDNDYVYMDDSGYYHTNCLYFDEDLCNWRFESDRDEVLFENNEYIHCYHHHGNLSDPEVFEEGDKFQFGLEIEVEFNDSNIKDIYNLTKDIVEVYSDDERNFHLETDGSLSEISFELVTAPIMYNGELPSWFKKTMESINKCNPMFWNCGGHIHIDRNSFNSSFSMRLFIYLFNYFKEMIEQISNRREKCHYARFQYPCSIEDINLQNNYMEQEDGKEKTNNRYCVINRENENTIEVRIFKGTTNLSIIKKRIDVLKNMVSFCNDYIMENIIEDDNLESINKISWSEFSGLTIKETIEFNN